MGIFQDHIQKWNAEWEKYASLHAMEEACDQIICRTTVHHPSPREKFDSGSLPVPKMWINHQLKWWKIDVFETPDNRSQRFTYKRIRGEKDHFIAGVRSHVADHSFIVVNGTDWYWMPNNIYESERLWAEEGFRPTEDQKIKFDAVEIAKGFYGNPVEKTVCAFK